MNESKKQGKQWNQRKKKENLTYIPLFLLFPPSPLLPTPSLTFHAQKIFSNYSLNSRPSHINLSLPKSRPSQAFPMQVKRPGSPSQNIAKKPTKVAPTLARVDPTVDYSQNLNPEIFTDSYKTRLREQIQDALPYKWGHISGLVNEDLLRAVRDEILTQVHFTQKETDIYKVRQSGDLRNLNGLPKEELEKLPNLLKLRNALYCPQFRDMISHVTQAGALSSHLYDMLLNIYNKLCHLLTHDDVIGSRRVLFILYLPDPDKPWKDHYGGALRLFGLHEENVPKSDFEKRFLPQFNDYAFFEVVPGYSFHDVEEVKADKQRISIQGWFHIPQPGEEGYVEGEQRVFELRSTLQVLESSQVEKYDFPKSLYDEANKIDGAELTKDLDIEYLLKFMDTSLLEPAKIADLLETFCEESTISLDNFLNAEYASVVRESIRKTELEDEVPRLSKDVEFPWKVAMSSVKRRYMYMDGRPADDDMTNLWFAHESKEEREARIAKAKSQSLVSFSEIGSKGDLHTAKLAQIAEFLGSTAFKKYLYAITATRPSKYQQILVRRFRPGLDFILATANGAPEPVLEATLNLTPSKHWESGENGGYELAMAVDDELELDPAIYRNLSGEDDIVATHQASWNKMVIMLRDNKILKFVKYVSFQAEGSRWDVSCQWVGEFDEESDEEENDEE